MSRRACSATFVAGLLSLSLALAGCEGEPPSGPGARNPNVAGAHQDRIKIEWPSGRFRRLQDAIDAAPDGALIEVQAGDHAATPLVVRGKDLVLAGAGSGRLPTSQQSDARGQYHRLLGLRHRQRDVRRDSNHLRRRGRQPVWMRRPAGIVHRGIVPAGSERAGESTLSAGNPSFTPQGS